MKNTKNMKTMNDTLDKFKLNDLEKMDQIFNIFSLFSGQQELDIYDSNIVNKIKIINSNHSNLFNITYIGISHYTISLTEDAINLIQVFS